MATKTMNNVKYKLRGDTWTNWNAKESVILEDREPAIVKVEEGDLVAAGVKVAGTYLKIGDGSTEFKELPYVSCVVEAKDIDGLEEFISAEIKDTDTQYKLEQDSNDKHTLKLSSKAKDGEEWKVEATITTEDTVYTAKDNSIDIDATGKTIGVKLDPDESNAIKLSDTGLKVTLPDEKVVSVQKKEAATEGFLTSYEVTVDGQPVGVAIDIPKDFLLKSAELKEVEDDDNPYPGAKTGDKYIDFVVNTLEDSEAKHIYLAVKDLVDVYTAGNGINVSPENAISLKISETSANGLSVSADGLALGVATDDAAGAMSAADHTKLTGIKEGATKVEASEENGKIKIDDVETDVYTLPTTVLDSTDDLVLDGGNA